MKIIKIDAGEALELLSWGKVRISSGMVVSLKLFEKLTAFLYEDVTLIKYCESCQQGECVNCINWTCKKDVCKCKGFYHEK